MSEDRHERPADDRPDDGSSPRGHHEDADEQPPGTSWAAGANPAGGAYDPVGEESLRLLLHGAADGLQPRPGALDEIRQAIPVRRARRRNALVGAGAAALVVGVTLPLMQAGVVPGPLNSDSQGNAAHSKPGEGPDQHEENGSVSGGSGGTDQHPDGSSGSGGSGKDDPSDDPSHEGSESPDGSATVGAPTCGADQLGNGDVQVGEPDARGRIYGSFELSNVSDQPCRVKGRDGMTASGVGELPNSDVQVLDHTPGGRATALPDPAQQSGPVILRPGEAYEVKFAWIPSPAHGQVCTPKDEEPEPSDPPPGGPGGGSGDPSGGDNHGGDGGDGGEGGNDGGDGNVGGETGSGGDEGMNPQSNGGTGGEDDDSAVVLNYTPAAGEPNLPSAYLDSACAGTVYRTGPMQSS